MVAAFSLLIRPCPIANFIEGKKALVMSGELGEPEETALMPLDLLCSWALHNTSVNRKGEDFEHGDCKGVAILLSPRAFYSRRSV